MEEGKATPLTQKLKHGGDIATTVRDAKTGVPVEKACLLAIDVSLGGFNGEGGWCSDAAGRFQAIPVEPGTYKRSGSDRATRRTAPSGSGRTATPATSAPGPP